MAMSEAICPFGLAEEVEVLSHLEGYRGGWFRCKIHDIQEKRNRRVSMYIEYLDFPGQAREWMDLYQAIPRRRQKQKFLMCRPLPPKLVRKHEVDRLSGPAQLGIVSEDPWKVGEDVEWLHQFTWWKAKVVSVREDGMVEVRQHWPPQGERKAEDKYFVKPEHLRPALSWSVARGWTVGYTWYVEDFYNGRYTPSQACLSNSRVKLFYLSEDQCPSNAEHLKCGQRSSDSETMSDVNKIQDMPETNASIRVTHEKQEVLAMCSANAKALLKRPRLRPGQSRKLTKADEVLQRSKRSNTLWTKRKYDTHGEQTRERVATGAVQGETLSDTQSGLDCSQGKRPKCTDAGSFERMEQLISADLLGEDALVSDVSKMLWGQITTMRSVLKQKVPPLESLIHSRLTAPLKSPKAWAKEHGTEQRADSIKVQSCSKGVDSVIDQVSESRADNCENDSVARQEQIQSVGELDVGAGLSATSSCIESELVSEEKTFGSSRQLQDVPELDMVGGEGLKLHVDETELEAKLNASGTASQACIGGSVGAGSKESEAPTGKLSPSLVVNMEGMDLVDRSDHPVDLLVSNSDTGPKEKVAGAVEDLASAGISSAVFSSAKCMEQLDIYESGIMVATGIYKSYVNSQELSCLESARSLDDVTENRPSMKFRIEQDGAAWQVIGVDPARNNHEIILAYVKTLEEASAICNAVQGLINDGPQRLVQEAPVATKAAEASQPCKHPGNGVIPAASMPNRPIDPAPAALAQPPVEHVPSRKSTVEAGMQTDLNLVKREVFGVTDALTVRRRSNKVKGCITGPIICLDEPGETSDKVSAPHTAVAGLNVSKGGPAEIICLDDPCGTTNTVDIPNTPLAAKEENLPPAKFPESNGNQRRVAGFADLIPSSPITHAPKANSERVGEFSAGGAMSPSQHPVTSHGVKYSRTDAGACTGVEQDSKPSTAVGNCTIPLSSVNRQDSCQGAIGSAVHQVLVQSTGAQSPYLNQTTPRNDVHGAAPLFRQGKSVLYGTPAQAASSQQARQNLQQFVQHRPQHLYVSAANHLLPQQYSSHRPPELTQQHLVGVIGMPGIPMSPIQQMQSLLHCDNYGTDMRQTQGAVGFWADICRGCRKAMNGKQSLGSWVDCMVCKTGLHTACALEHGLLSMMRPVSTNQQGEQVAGVYFSCSNCQCHPQLVLPRFLKSIRDGVDRIIKLGQNQRTLPAMPHFSEFLSKALESLRSEIMLLELILRNAPEPFLETLRDLMTYCKQNFNSLVFTTVEVRKALTDYIIRSEG